MAEKRALKILPSYFLLALTPGLSLPLAAIALSLGLNNHSPRPPPHVFLRALF